MMSSARTGQSYVAAAAAVVLLASPGLGAWQGRPASPPAPQGPPKPAVPSDRQVPFPIGELLTYNVSFSGFITAGTATLNVKERRPATGRGAYDIEAIAIPSAAVQVVKQLYFKLETLLDTANLSPNYAVTYANEGGRVKIKTTKWLGPTTVDFTIQTNGTLTEKRTLAPQTQDALSLIYVLRVLMNNAAAQDGRTLPIPFTDGGDMYYLNVKVAAREPVKTPAGTFPALRVTSVVEDGAHKPIPGRKLTIWLSDDARRLPLKFETTIAIGSFVLTLNKVQ